MSSTTMRNQKRTMSVRFQSFSVCMNRLFVCQALSDKPGTVSMDKISPVVVTHLS
jgi:hypothetical protein